MCGFLSICAMVLFEQCPRSARREYAVILEKIRVKNASSAYMTSANSY